MQIAHFKVLTDLYHCMPFKSNKLALITFFVSSIAIAGCSTGHNDTHAQPAKITSLGYSLPIKNTTDFKLTNTNSTHTQPSHNPSITKTVKSPKPIKVASSNYVGRAPHICTPSGFGSKTRCFNRS